MKRELSVVIPAYNEEESVGRTLADVTAFLRVHVDAFEVLIVDDGSTDRTRDIADGFARGNPEVRLIRQPQNKGKGMAVKTGVALARYRWCLFMDADGATSIEEWPAFERELIGGARAVQASRHLPGSRIVRPQPLPRRVLGAGYRALCRMMFGLAASDFNCGFKAYETELARSVYGQVQMTDWSFDVEAIARLKRAGVTPVELPVRWSHCEKKSSLAPIQSAVKTFRSLGRLQKILSS